jgi:hypothetical protein
VWFRGLAFGQPPQPSWQLSVLGVTVEMRTGYQDRRTQVGVAVQEFVMVPVESLKPGDVVAPAKTPTRYAQPVAEVNLGDDGVELVFMEKSLYSEQGIRVAGLYPYQYPCALMGGVEERIKETVERWVAGAGG